MHTLIRPICRAVAALSLATAPSLAGEVVFSQSPVADTADVGFGFFSHTAPTPTNSFLHADNFVLARAAAISGVRWWGAAEGGDGPDIVNVAAFEITIFSAGQFFPDQPLYTERFDLGRTDPLATGRAGNGVNEYVHTATLSQTFAAEAGTRYWIAIAAELIDPAADGWLWGDASEGDTVSASRRYSTGRWSGTSPYDSAFELLAVPAPTTLPLVAAVPMLTARRRRGSTIRG